MPSLIEQKALLRQEMLKKRKSLMLKDVQTEVFAEYPVFQKVRTIAAYWPIAGEIDVRPLLRKLHDLGKTCALPRVVAKDSALIFKRWRVGDELVAGPHNTKHPKDDAEELVPELIITPLLAFDEKGSRLGFGGGYYDRTFAHYKGLKVGVAYDEQQVPCVPMEGFDQPLDWIITPTRAIDCLSSK